MSTTQDFGCVVKIYAPFVEVHPALSASNLMAAVYLHRVHNMYPQKFMSIFLSPISTRSCDTPQLLGA